MKLILLLIILLICVFVLSSYIKNRTKLRKHTNLSKIPKLEDLEIVDVTFNAVTVQVRIKDDGGGYLVLESGFCIGFSEDVTFKKAITSTSHYNMHLSLFSDRFIGLKPDTEYFVRAYASNVNGKTYGRAFRFKTKSVNTYDYVKGALRGYFSVSENKKVVFSQGNLQYCAKNGIWRFAEQQWQVIGVDNRNSSADYSGWIDLFGWGTSGWEDGVKSFQPYSVDTEPSNYFYEGNSEEKSPIDWGIFNEISGTKRGLWRTLTSSEWQYVVKLRTDAQLLCGIAVVNGVKGVVILPDNWISPSEVNFVPGFKSIEKNTFTVSSWSKMEEHGALFLPAAGFRYGSYVDSIGLIGRYWSISSYNKGYSYMLSFNDYGVYASDYDSRHIGLSVRLVSDLE